MKVINIDPWKKEIKLGKLESLSENDDEFTKKLLNDAIQIDENLKVAAYPVIGQEKHFFYIIKQYGDRVRAYSFEGMGIVFGDVDEETVKELEDSVVWH